MPHMRARGVDRSPAARVRLRTGQYAKFAALKGWTTHEAAAAVIGVHPVTISRLVRGLTAPGERFIAGVLAAIPEVDFGDLFEVTGDDGDAAIPLRRSS